MESMPITEVVYNVLFNSEQGYAIGVIPVTVSAGDVAIWALEKDILLGLAKSEDRVTFGKKEGKLVEARIVRRTIPVGEGDLQDIAITKAKAQDLQNGTDLDSRSAAIIAIRCSS
ncbi:MAG: hypothetical protein NTV48_02965 [Candidatus Vogelbacteria bacterium]|nr:hypothetical protein [Candidatus Vogelbacteria bacterium]